MGPARPSTISRVLVVFLLAALIAAVPSPALAEPTTPAIEKKRAEAESAQAELDRMATGLEVQFEEYNRIAEALEKTRGEIRVARADLRRAEARLDDGQRQLASRATAIYKEGPGVVLSVLLGTSSFQEFITRFDLFMRIGRSDAQLVAEVKDAKAHVESTKRALESREAEQVALKREAEMRTRQIEAGIAQQEQYLTSLESEIQRLIEEERARQRRLEEERARRAAERAAALGRTPTPAGELGAGHPEVVALALQYVGVPYVWGGSSPSGFDCSGLCWYVYGQIGVDLPRTSRDQYRVGSHIAPDRLDLLRPGDLVFFGTGGDPRQVHHVGIYVGEGDFVHAPQIGDVVKVSSLTERISTRGDYVGASRF